MSNENSSGHAPLIGRLVVVGLGLIGGSFAKGLRESGLCREVVGVDLDAPSRLRAVELGVTDRCEASLAAACVGADVIQLAVPILAMERVLGMLAGLDLGNAVITDVGSAKGNIVRAARAALPGHLSRLVPGHPIAGSEQSGVEASNGALFQRHKVILTPLPETEPAALAVVDALWRALGADVEHMDVERHDEVLAATSHLPHLLAFNLVDSLARRDENLEIFRYAAGGFRDFTRIAGSDPVMWHDIFLANRDAVLRQLDAFRADLDTLRDAVEQRDGHQLLGVFTRARMAREHFGKILARRAYVEPPAHPPRTLVSQPCGPLQGTLALPGDRSICHRAIILGCLAEGRTVIDGVHEGEDALATLQAFRDMGVVIEGPQAGRVVIHGVGLRGLHSAPGAVYLGSSGASMRLLAGLLAGQGFSSELSGDSSLSQRSLTDVIEPLRAMGAGVTCAEGGRPPLRVQGGRPLAGIRHHLPVASAQVKTSLLLAGLYADGPTEVLEPAPTRDHTERMLRAFGYPLAERDGALVLVPGGQLHATAVQVPGDLSLALYYLVAATICEGSGLLLPAVGVNPTRTAALELLARMGARIDIKPLATPGAEPVADLYASAATLSGSKVPAALLRLAVDELPALMVAAACAAGQTVFEGIGGLRASGQRRVKLMVEGLRALGSDCRLEGDQVIICGGALAGGEVHSQGDPRVAMAFSVAALRARAPVRVHGCAALATSFPTFLALCERAGMHVSEEGQS